MTIGRHEINIVPQAVGIITNAGHGVIHRRLFQFSGGRILRTAWAALGDIEWVI